MSEVVNSDITSESYDAQQAVEEIQESDNKTPSANVEADYEASKQFSTSPIDQTEAGAQAADAATASDFTLPQPDEVGSSLDATGNPDDYKQMAQNIDSLPDNSAGATTSDAVYQKVIEKGKAGE